MRLPPLLLHLSDRSAAGHAARPPSAQPPSSRAALPGTTACSPARPATMTHAIPHAHYQRMNFLGAFTHPTDLAPQAALPTYQRRFCTSHPPCGQPLPPPPAPTPPSLLATRVDFKFPTTLCPQFLMLYDSALFASNPCGGGACAGR